MFFTGTLTIILFLSHTNWQQDNYSIFLYNVSYFMCSFKLLQLNFVCSVHSSVFGNSSESPSILRIRLASSAVSRQLRQGSRLRSHLHRGQHDDPTNSTNYYLSQRVALQPPCFRSLHYAFFFFFLNNVPASRIENKITFKKKVWNQYSRN